MYTYIYIYITKEKARIVNIMVNAVVLSTLAEHRTRFAIRDFSCLWSILSWVLLDARSCVHTCYDLRQTIDSLFLFQCARSALSYRNFYMRKIHLLLRM